MKNFFLSSDQNFYLKKEEKLDYDSWMEIISHNNSNIENIKEKEYLKDLIFTADPFLPIYKSQLNLLNYLDSSKYYKISYSTNDIISFFEYFFQNQNELKILSAFQIDTKSNDIIIETNEIETIKQKFPALNIIELNPSFIVQNFCNSTRFLPFKMKNRNFGRIIIPEYKNQPIEIFDVDFKQKKAIIRLLPVLEVPKFSTTKPEPETFGVSVLELSYLRTKKERFKVSFDGKKTIDGYRFRDTKYSSNFIIMKTRIENIKTWSSNLTQDELKIFMHARKIHDKDHPKYRPSYIIDDDDLYDSYSLDEDEEIDIEQFEQQQQQTITNEPKTIEMPTVKPIHNTTPPPLVNYRPPTIIQNVSQNQNTNHSFSEKQNLNSSQELTTKQNQKTQDSFDSFLNWSDESAEFFTNSFELFETKPQNNESQINKNDKQENKGNQLNSNEISTIDKTDPKNQTKDNYSPEIKEIIRQCFVDINYTKLKPPKAFYNSEQENKWKEEIQRNKEQLEIKVRKYREAISKLSDLSKKYPSEQATITYFRNLAYSRIDVLHSHLKDISMMELEIQILPTDLESIDRYPIKTKKSNPTKIHSTLNQKENKSRLNDYETDLLTISDDDEDNESSDSDDFIPEENFSSSHKKKKNQKSQNVHESNSNTHKILPQSQPFLHTQNRPPQFINSTQNQQAQQSRPYPLIPIQAQQTNSYPLIPIQTQQTQSYPLIPIQTATTNQNQNSLQTTQITQNSATTYQTLIQQHMIQNAQLMKEKEDLIQLVKESQEQKKQIKALQNENNKLKNKIAEHEERDKKQNELSQDILELLQSKEEDFSSPRQIKIMTPVRNMIGQIIEKRNLRSFTVRVLPQFIDVPATIVTPASFIVPYIPIQYDLVQINNSTEFGVVLDIYPNEFEIINQANKRRLISIETPLTKLKSDNKTTDMKGNRLYIGDHVEIVISNVKEQKGLLGEVLHVYKNIVFAQFLTNEGIMNLALSSNQLIETKKQI